MFVLVRRKTPYSPERTGIVLAVDLEEYSYEKQSDAAIRATEATILERIPPRLKIRERAELEFPHIMLLYDDPCDLALGDLKRRSDLQKLYDFELNMGGGHVSGFFVPDYEEVIAGFERLKKDGLLFMVGDGNHSLATAKALWEKIKLELPKSEREGHPARYALCEAVNLYDEGIRFEAIHRLVKGVDAEKFSKYFSARRRKRRALYRRGEREYRAAAGSGGSRARGRRIYIRISGGVRRKRRLYTRGYGVGAADERKFWFCRHRSAENGQIGVIRAGAAGRKFAAQDVFDGRK